MMVLLLRFSSLEGGADVPAHSVFPMTPSFDRKLLICMLLQQLRFSQNLGDNVYQSQSTFPEHLLQDAAFQDLFHSFRNPAESLDVIFDLEDL